MGTFSTADMQQVVGHLIKQLPGSGKKPDQNCLYVKGLPTNTSDLDLYRIFAPYGAIPATGVKAMMTPEGSCTGVGFVDFQDEVCAHAAAESLNGLVLPDGTALEVRIKKAKGAAPRAQQEPGWQEPGWQDQPPFA